MSTARDTWLTTDPSDDGSDEAISQIACELARNAAEVLDAAENIEPPTGMIAAALMTGEWGAVQSYYADQLASALRNRAVDLYNAETERSRWFADEARDAA